MEIDPFNVVPDAPHCAPTLRGHPLDALRERWRHEGDVFRLPDGATCFVDPVVVKKIFENSDHAFVDHSDFFRLRRGIFGPRPAQVEIGKAGRQFLRASVPNLLAAAPQVIRSRLAHPTVWPDEGSHLLHDLTGSLLLAAERADVIRVMLRDIVMNSVLAGARQRRSRIDRLRFRRRVMRVLSAEVVRRRRLEGSPYDLLDIVVHGAGPDARVAEVVEVFLSFVFALLGSTGLALAWSVLLLGTNPATDAPSSSVVRESLRLFPVAWYFGRTPHREHELAGVRMNPHRDAVVCTYLVHRHPDHWADPDDFRPSRWADASGPLAYVPFGWGPHSCTGAAIVIDIVAALLDTIRTIPTTLVLHGTGMIAGAALAPPAFTLRPATPPTVDRKGGES